MQIENDLVIKANYYLKVLKRSNKWHKLSKKDKKELDNTIESLDALMILTNDNIGKEAIEQMKKDSEQHGKQTRRTIK